MREEDVRRFAEHHAAITRRLFLALAATAGSSVLILKEFPREWFQRRKIQPLVTLSGNVVDGTAAVVGEERIQWRGQEVVSLCGCKAYSSRNHGLRYKVDSEVPQMPASAYFPSAGLHVVEWVAVDKEGNEFEPPILSFIALFS
ncbi:MAG: hypothetical protein A3B24_00580 [Candidatus Wildermuthbacteria bacterium RIFCSPLOWO2_01_FULL_48_16]|uniref:Uncharacterized protein n=1 Tax=Candidatus Wildermuthbacteria bacterium RIFCSPLOWO2_01_FULL_48_16 TaxID=1802461 RepID=A0A1G2RK27_9BACT|nr:MAG: hypothetical protein A3J57_01175 [Candidatus Wildermuthbacteria bacterium RIFCSPHIGHO2_02_FULL_49_12b]OHA72719.1 MAG: hypothetical protein A3B24_00580 [Candidatus Wildermuthbacteria bacterium RIFCSPLOWO2_01_FULL_48_16]